MIISIQYLGPLHQKTWNSLHVNNDGVDRLNLLLFQCLHIRLNKKISVFWVTGLKILDRVGTHHT